MYVACNSQKAIGSDNGLVLEVVWVEKTDFHKISRKSFRKLYFRNYFEIFEFSASLRIILILLLQIGSTSDQFLRDSNAIFPLKNHKKL
jgi:hypothetical protein